MPSPEIEGDAAAQGCRDLLAAALADAAASWGRFDLTLDRFAPRASERVTRRLVRAGDSPAPATVREWMGRTALADLALAVACSDGVDGAWNRLVERLSPRLRGLARSRGVPDADARALAADVLSEIAVAGPGAHGRRPIDSYEGAGSLFGWAAVILLRRLHRERSRASARPTTGDDVGSEALDDRRDPLAALAGEDLRARFGDALAAAWGALAGRDRLALAWRYLDGLPQTRIATMLRVSEPHTSRLLARAVERLRSGVRTGMGPDAPDEASWPALAEALRRHLVTARPVPPLPVENPPPGGGGRT